MTIQLHLTTPSGLVPVSCASCKHYDAFHGVHLTRGSYGFCTNPASWHAHKAMPPDEGCTKFEA